MRLEEGHQRSMICIARADYLMNPVVEDYQLFLERSWSRRSGTIRTENR